MHRIEDLRLEEQEILDRREGTTGELFDRITSELFRVRSELSALRRSHVAAVTELRTMFD